MAGIGKYTGTQLKAEFMEISSPQEFMDWKERYAGYEGAGFDEDMNRKFNEILRMAPSHPMDTPNCHIELWKKE